MLSPKKQKKSYFTRIRDLFIDGQLSQRTMELYSKTIREILRMVPGLDPACIAELENLPKKEDITEASGDPFQQSHLAVMFKLIDTVTEIVQILFWIGASGGPQIVDTVFLPFWGIDWVTGLISYRRVKTGERIEFCALPPLLGLLKKRRDRLGPNAVYVLPELIFKKNDLRDPECNQEGWHVIAKWKKVPKKVADRGAGNGAKQMTDFLKLCGIKTKGLTYKSFRKHNISFWASIGIKLKTRMRMAGHSKESAHYRYDVPAAFEIIRAKDITWRYYQAIMKSEEFFIPTTPFDIYEALMDHWKQFPAIMRDTMRQELDGSFQPLYQLMRDCFAAQRAENAQLREQLRVQEEHLRAIRATCQGISDHLGIKTPSGN